MCSVAIPRGSMVSRGLAMVASRCRLGSGRVLGGVDASRWVLQDINYC